jgi:hypothetical protein
VYRASFLLLVLAILMGCGGGSSSSSSNNNGGGSSGGGGSSPVGSPAIVNVSSGATAGGVDINVPAPVASPAPNATLLGAAIVPSGGGSVSISLTNGSTNVNQGSSIIVAVAGDGISSNMTATISGPPDISVDTTSFKGITLQNGQKGVTFQATVSPSAVLGARTILLEDPQQDLTAFAGGLQVVQ